MDFLRINSWAISEPAHTIQGVVQIGAAYTSALLMDGSQDDSLTLTARKDDGSPLILDPVKLRGIQFELLKGIHLGATADEAFEAAVQMIVRVVNRGLFIKANDGSPYSGLEF